MKVRNEGLFEESSNSVDIIGRHKAEGWQARDEGGRELFRRVRNQRARREPPPLSLSLPSRTGVLNHSTLERGAFLVYKERERGMEG